MWLWSLILDLKVRGQCRHGKRLELPGASVNAFLLSRASSICVWRLSSNVSMAQLVRVRHPVLSRAQGSSSLGVISTWLMMAFTTSLNLLWGLPCFHFPEVNSPIISCFGSLLSSMRMTCPTQGSRLFRIMASMLVDSAMLRTCMLETRSCHLTFRMVCRLRIRKHSSCFRCLLYRVYVSQPWRRLVRMTIRYTLSFMDCLMLCWFRTWVFRRPRAWLALQIWVLISLLRLPSLLITLPRYLKLSISSAGCHQLRWWIGGQLQQVLAETGPLSFQGWWWDRRGGRLLQTCWQRFGGQTPYVPWGHSRQQTVLPGQSFSQSLSWLSVGEGPTGGRRANIVGTLSVQGPWWHGLEGEEQVEEDESQHTPLLDADASPSESTCPVMLSWNWWIQFTNLVGHPSLDRITQRASLLTMSKAFVRSMKTAKRSIFCLMVYREDYGIQRRSWCTEKIDGAAVWAESTHWAYGRFSSEMLVMRWLRMTRARIFPATDRRDAPVVAAVSLIAPVLKQGDECGIPDFFGHILFFPDAGEEWVECFAGH